ncbi:MAG: PAS domain-containing protein [Kiloniellales bacterium]
MMARSRAAQSEQTDPGRPESVETAAGLFASGGPFEQFPGGVLLVGRDGRVLSANPGGQSLAELLLNGPAPELEQAIAAALDGKAAQINPLLLDGAQAAEEAGQAYDLVALPWITGNEVLIIARDITLERSLRAALIESRQRYKDLVEVSSDFAWETDSEGCFTFVSPCGAVGYAAGQLVGQRAADFLLDSEDAGALHFTTRVPVEATEIWLRAADGKAACLSSIAVPLAGPGGEWLGARGVCRDVTPEHAPEGKRARPRKTPTD